MFCPGCGANNEPGARFCFECGRRLLEGEEKPRAEGPAWRDFQTPTEPELPPPVVIEAPPPPLPPQVVIGAPKGAGPLRVALVALAGLAAVGGVAAGVYFAATRVDWGSLPLVGESSKAAPKSAPTEEAKPPPILASLEMGCKDSGGGDCRLTWDVTGVTSPSEGLSVAYELRATGQPNCRVRVAADKDLLSQGQGSGRPTLYLEGGRGRYYPLVRSEGFGASGGDLPCDKPASGVWTFANPAGEAFVKLRYPGLAPLRLELSAGPVAARILPADDPINVIPAQAVQCTTPQNQPCRGLWEIGPYGVHADGSPVVFFAVRFEGPANCQVNWTADLEYQKAAVGRGERGIHLEAAGNPDLGLIAVGGLALQNAPQPCGVVLAGWWKFARGALASTVILSYPDLPPVQIPIRP